MKNRAARFRSALSGALFASTMCSAHGELLIDFNDRENNTAAVSANGFQPFVIDSITSAAAIQTGSITRPFGAISVTVSPSVPGNSAKGVDDRLRGTPASAGAFTEELLLRDFIFSRDLTGSDGINIEVTGLLASKTYPVSIWSFDTSSAGSRVSDWTANGVLVKEDYMFDGRVAPADNTTYRFDFEVMTDAAGKIRIEGRRDTTSVDGSGVASFGVFVNALRIGDPTGDSDGDGMTDSWETLNGLVVGVNDSALDPDNDFSTNLQEFTNGTNPKDNDTDDDTLLDGRETNTGTWTSTSNTGTNPLLPDSDGDGLPDGVENPDLPFTGAAQPGTDPNLKDSDADTYFDGEELTYNSNPDDVSSFPNIAAGSTLAIDFDSTSLTTQHGFESLDISTNWSKDIGTKNVTVTAVGSPTLDHRDRDQANGTGGFNGLWRDFLFANTGPTEADGMDIKITGLQPNTQYPIVMWSFDKTSAGARSASWAATDSGGPAVVKIPKYTFNGSNAAPVSLQQYRMDFNFTTDGTGAITLQGRAVPDPNANPQPVHNVFVNAFIVGAPAGPAAPFEITTITRAANGVVTLTWRSVPGVNYTMETTLDLTNWNEVLDGLTGAPASETTTANSPAFGPEDGGKRYFRIRRP